MRVEITKALMLMFLLATATACKKDAHRQPSRFDFLCGSHHCRVVCSDGKCYSGYKSGFDVGHTDSQSAARSSQQPEEPEEANLMWKYVFFTEWELHQIRTKIPEFEKILAVMGSDRVAVVVTFVNDLPDFILGLDDKYIKIINEQLVKMEKFDAATVAALFPEQMGDPLFATIIKFIQ